MHMKIALKEQLAICLQHMEDKFGCLMVPKKGRVHTQHRVLTNQLADIDGLNVRHHQPRPRYAEGKTNLSLKLDNTWRSNSRF
jgi:hypothetical protein